MKLTKYQYKIYGEYDTHLTSGESINLDLRVFINTTKTKKLLEKLVGVPNKDMLCISVDTLVEQETEEFKKLESKAYDLLEIMAELQLVNRAVKYNDMCRRVEELKTTDNRWEMKEYTNSTQWFISNKVYSFEISLTDYGQPYKKHWRVCYYFNLNIPDTKRIIIKNIDLPFGTKDDAIKYVEGRKKYYSKYFKELYPVVPKERFEYFSLYDILLKPYKLEE